MEGIVTGLSNTIFLNVFLPLEYNPKLSDATKGTRVAYVKFMANVLKDPKGGVKIVDETQKSTAMKADEILLRPNFKSIIVRPPSVSLKTKYIFIIND